MFYDYHLQFLDGYSYGARVRMSTEFEHTARAKRIHALSYRLIERILSVIAVLGLACLCVGLVLHISGKASNSLTVARIGAYMLVAGIMLVVPRFLYWIAVEIAERG